MNDKYISRDNLELAIDGLKVGMTPNWNENDKSSVGYIENKPFYTEYGTIVDNYSGRGIRPKCNFIVGNTYDVIWNGIKYKGLKCRLVDDCKCIGGDGYPFYIDDDGGDNFYVEPENGFTVSIFGDVVHQIDEKYIPDTVVRTDDVNDVLSDFDYKISVKMDKSNPTGTGSFSLGRKVGTAIGVNSFAAGSVVTASGKYSHAEGYKTTASGDHSHAEGNDTTAAGNHSHTEGYLTKAVGQYSHAEGNDTTASGDYSHAEGNDTTASGDYSHAEGVGTTASGIVSHAEGGYTTASGNYSHAEGIYTVASGTYSHAEGDKAVASSIYSHAEGFNTFAGPGHVAHVEGYYTVASGMYSHAEGSNTFAFGQASHAEGRGSISYNVSITGEANAETYILHSTLSLEHIVGSVIKLNNTFTEIIDYDSNAGVITVANTLSNIALNAANVTIHNGNIASGMHSHTEGLNTLALGKASHAEGNNTIATSHYSHAEGKYNVKEAYTIDVEITTETFSNYIIVCDKYYVDQKNGTIKGLSPNYTIQAPDMTIGQYLCRNKEAYKLISIDSTTSSDLTGTFEKHTVCLKNDYIHVAGNGESNDTRSNAHTLDWDGNAWFAGDVYVGSTSGTNKDEGSVKLQKSITGTPGQFVVIGDDGNITTKTIGVAEEASF